MIAKSTIEAKFKRSGIKPKRTWLWIDMDETVRAEILRYCYLQNEEHIIICFYKSSSYCLLFTTERIMVIKEGTAKNFFFYDIDDVRLDEIFDNRKDKETNDVIDLFLASGDHVKLLIEERTWPLLYSIIKLLKTTSTGS